MNASTFSFIAWSVFMVAMLVGLGFASRRGRSRAQQTEDIASQALPAIGRVAERTHSMRFGVMPITAGGGDRQKRTSWYPPTRTKAAK